MPKNASGLCPFCGHAADDPRCFCYDEFAPAESVFLPCRVCRKNLVNAGEGYDSCEDCRAAQ
jgi:hypothetical protein